MMLQSTGAHSQYHAGIIQFRKRTDRHVGRQLQLHLQPLDRQPVRREQLLLERARTAEQLHRGPGLAVLQPGPGVRPKPARLAAQDRRCRRSSSCRSARERGSSRPAASANILLGGLAGDAGGHVPERLPDRRQPEPDRHRVSARRHAASERGRPARTSWCPVTSPTASRRTPRTTCYLNKAAFTTAPANQFGNAPRTLPGVYSPWRNNVDLSVSKAFQTGKGTTLNARMEVLNMFNLVQWAAPASIGVRQLVVRADHQPGEQHAPDPVHRAVPVLTGSRSVERLRSTLIPLSSRARGSAQLTCAFSFSAARPARVSQWLRTCALDVPPHSSH